MYLESLIYANKLKPNALVQLHSLSQRCKKTQLHRIHANYNILRVKFYTQIFLICVYFLVYFCVYIFTRVFHVCFSRGICMQFGGFSRMKHACNAAMPAAWTCAVEQSQFSKPPQSWEKRNTCMCRITLHFNSYFWFELQVSGDLKNEDSAYVMTSCTPTFRLILFFALYVSDYTYSII